MAHTAQCENAIDPNCSCNGCGGLAHGLFAGRHAITVLAAPEPEQGGRRNGPSVALVCAELERRANGVGGLNQGSVWACLVTRADLLGRLADEAIACAEAATAHGDADELDPVKAPRRPHVLCEVLAQVALALDKSLSTLKVSAVASARDAVRDGARGLDPAARAVLEATAEALAARAVEYFIDASGVKGALWMARVGALVACPRVDEHPAVRKCAAPLVEEPITDELKASLGDLPDG